MKTKTRINVAPSLAYHEAGHAAIAVYFGVGLKRVSVMPGDDYAGICSQVRQPSMARLDSDNSDALTKRTEKLMMVALAGEEAQRKFAPTSVRGHQGHSDRRAVFEYAFSICGSAEEATALVELLRIRTRNLLRLPFIWSTVKAIAKELLRSQEIKGSEAKAIWEGAFLSMPRRKTVYVKHESLAEAEAAGIPFSKVIGNTSGS